MVECGELEESVNFKVTDKQGLFLGGLFVGHYLNNFVAGRISNKLFDVSYLLVWSCLPQSTRFEREDVRNLRRN